jgi:tartrate dehydratase beta subunit/fumarate hydratase class I family protein
MTLVKDIRKTFTDTTPVYAAVGVTDLAVERLRDARARATTRAAAVRADLDITTMQDKAVKRIEKVTEQAHQIPVQFRNQTIEAAGKARVTYSGLAVRGEKLVKRIRNQKSTKDLVAQAGSTVSLGKGAVTTVRNAAQGTQRAAKVTLATGRREAGSVAAAVQSDVRANGTTAGTAPVKAPTVVEGTGTPAKKSTASAERATRSVAAGASKAASTAKTGTPKADS